MPHRGQLATDEEINEAGWAGVWGAVNGAARWGFYSAALGGVAYFASPVYRNLTFQFKVFLQMSGMTAGSIIEADRRLREYEIRARRMRKLKRDQKVWQAYEEDYGKDGVGTVAKPEAQIKNMAPDPPKGS